MKKMRKRIISLALAVAMMLTMMPNLALAAFADDGANPSGSEQTGDPGYAQVNATAQPSASAAPQETAKPKNTEMGKSPSEPVTTPTATTGDSVVALFQALPAAQAVTADNKDAYAAQLTEAFEALYALTEQQQACFEEQHADLLAAALALNDAITGQVPVTMSIMTADELTAAIINAPDGGTVELTGNVTLSERIIISKNLKITSGAGGPYTITRASGFTLHLFAQNASGKTLTFENVILDGARDTVTATTAMLLANAGGIALNAGAVVQNNKNGTSNGGGGAVQVQANCTLTLNGGTIKNCYCAGYGGAVYSGGTVALNSNSTIQNCEGRIGGAVYAAAGSVNLNGGTVSQNKSNGSSGGGFYIYGATRFNMTAGSIAGNTAYAAGGGIFAGSSTVGLVISGGTISDNRANGNAGGGIYASKRDVSISNATISGNTALTNGGGIYHKGDSAAEYTLSISNTGISKNTSEYQDEDGDFGGGGIFEDGYGKLCISEGVTITENLAHSDGGGLYIAAEASAELNGTDAKPVTISKNNAWGFSGNNENFSGGGGIYGCGNAVLKMTGNVSVIENKNESGYGGGGICGWTNYMNSGLEIQMSGTIIVKDNVTVSYPGDEISNLFVSMPIKLLGDGLTEASCIGITTQDDPCVVKNQSGEVVTPGHDVPFTTLESDTASYSADRDLFFSDRGYPIGAGGETGKCIYVMPPVEKAVLSGDDASVTYGSISGSLTVNYTENDARCAYSQQWYEGSSADAGKLIGGQTNKALAIPTDLCAGSYTYTVRVTADLNYSRTSVFFDKTFTVTVARAPVTVIGATASNRPYNAQTTVSVSGGTLSGVIAGDIGMVQLSGTPVGTITDASVSNGKAVAVTGYTLGGRQADNYTVVQPTDVTVDITAAPIIIQWKNLTAIYNGSTQYPVVSDFTGKVGSEEVSVTVEGRAAAGSYTVTAALNGADKANYILANPIANFTIQKAPVAFTITDNSYKADGNAHTATVAADIDSANYTVSYRKNNVPVIAPTQAGTYDVYAEITNENFRHAGAADGSARKIGLLTIYTETAPSVYMVDFDTDGGSAVSAMEAAISGTVRVLPAAPVKSGSSFAGWKYDGKIYQAGEPFVQPAADVAFTAVWVVNTYKISGVVDQEGNPVLGAVVTLTLGSRQIAQTTTDETGKYSFSNVASGLYNLRAEWNGIIQTIAVEIVSANRDDQNIVLPAGKTNSIVEVAAGTPDVVVAALEKTFNDPSIYTQSDQTQVAAGGIVEICAEVKVSSNAQAQAEIETELAEEESIALFVDIDLSKVVKDANGIVQSTDKITETAQILTFTISLPADLQGKANYVVYRQHNDEVQQLTNNPGDNNGEYIEVNDEKTEIAVHVKKFSVYGLGYSAAEITFDANGGTCATVTQLTDSEGKLESLPIATKTGDYSFGGWFTAATGGTKIDSNYVFTADTTVYAQWNYSGDTTTYYTITATAGQGGRFDTGSTVFVPITGSAGFTIIPNKGYVIANVKVDGKSVGAVSYYAFADVRENHTISATFKRGSRTNPQTGVGYDGTQPTDTSVSVQHCDAYDDKLKRR